MTCPICSNILIVYKKALIPGICYHECLNCGYTRELRNNTLYSVYKKKKI